MSALNLFFWQSIPSPHQAAMMRALANMGHKTTLVVDHMESPVRKAMGWQVPDMTGVRVLKSIEVDVQEFVASQSLEAVHLMTGIRGCKTGLAVAKACLKYGRRMGFVVEPGDPRSIAGMIRRCIYYWDSLWLRKGVDFILAMGQTGVDWYTDSGYSRMKVFPFCYAVDRIQTEIRESSPGSFRISYVGSLIRLKRVDLLIQALSRLQDRCWALSILGDGPEYKHLRALAEYLGISERISWYGYQEHNAVIEQVAASDLLVLPSEYDGWGAVVNESLMTGVPVICSDACGSCDLVRDSMLGRVFHSGSVMSCSIALSDMMDCGKPDITHRHYVREWSDCITGESVAKYVSLVLEHIYEGGVRPNAPWRGLLI